MTIRLLFFSLIRDIAGVEEMDFDLSSEQVSVSELLGVLYEKFDGLEAWNDKLLIAINCEYADRDDLIKPGDEVAVMPPVQGG